MTGDFRSYCQDIANFALPRKAWINSVRFFGERVNYNFLYDVRAIRSLKKAACHFHSNLTNPSSQWFGLRSEEKMMQYGSVQRYFKEWTDILYDVNNGSNFNNSAIEYYTDLLAFGTTNIYTEEDDKRVVRYTPIPIEQYQPIADASGYINSLIRCFKYTATQCIDYWGDKCSKAMKDAYKEGKYYEYFDIVHYVYERKERDIYKIDSGNMEFGSVWIDKKEKTVLSESGFNEFPFHVCRQWRDHSSPFPFGFSSTMDILASIKLVNAQKRTVLRGGMKRTDPPFAMANRGWLAPMNFNPAAANYFDPDQITFEQGFKTIDTRGDTGIGVELMKMEHEEIDNGYFLPFFEAISSVNKEMSVPEFDQRLAENMSLVGPVVGNVLDEGITPMLKRLYGICNRRLLGPPPPKEIQGKELKIIYLSPLAKAQRSGELKGLMGFLNLVASIEKFQPGTRYKVDSDKAVDKGADLYGVPDILREQEEVDKIRQKEHQLAMMQAQMQVSDQAGKTAHNVAKANKTNKEAAAV